MTERDDAALDAASTAGEPAVDSWLTADNQPAPAVTAEPVPGQPVDAAGHPAGDNDGSLLGIDDPATPAEDGAVFDPAAHTAAEVSAYLRVAAPDEVTRVVAAERTGKARRSLVNAGPGPDAAPAGDDRDSDDDRPRTREVGKGLAPVELLPGEDVKPAELAEVDQLDEDDDEPVALARVENDDDQDEG